MQRTEYVREKQGPYHINNAVIGIVLLCGTFSVRRCVGELGIHCIDKGSLTLTRVQKELIIFLTIIVTIAL